MEIRCPICGEIEVDTKKKFPVLCCDIRSKGKGCNEPLPVGVRDYFMKNK